ncbi:MAG: hypothetical protein Q9159_005577 [Coniocarpon cinnabarinum]
MAARYRRLPSQPSMDIKDTPPSSPASHICKPSKPFYEHSHSGSAWRAWTAKIRRIKKRYLILIGAAVAAVIVAALVAGIVEWQKDESAHPAVQDIEADVVIWFDNDLRGMDADGAILLNRTVSEADASLNCSALGEHLLDPSSINTTALLNWFGYSGGSISQLYWVSKDAGQECSALTSDSQVVQRNCSESLPALCTSSAAVADSINQDTSEGWQIAVNSSGQSLKGYRDKRSFRFFGVRYATPPSRFRHSTMFSDVGSFDAIEPGSVCMQGTQGSEDCLFLNIWTTYLPRSGNFSPHLKPVVLWLHGGAFESDSGTDPTFDGGNWASRGDVVTVTINYRLGNLGFLALNDTSATGNYGFGDQITALDWLHEHIHDFGGDPNRISIAGQSAGAASARAMLGSPMAKGKFAAVIMQSNLGGYGFAQPYSSYMSLADYEANHTDTIIQQAGCGGGSSLSCLQKTSATTLSTIQQAAFLVQDGVYITSPELSFNDSSKIASVPILMGQMQGDAVYFVAPAPQAANLTDALQDTPWNASILANLADFTRGDSTQNDVTKLSSNSTNSDDIAAVYNVTVEAGNDAMFRCVDQATAHAVADKTNLGPVWYYEMQRSYISYPSRPACNAPIEPDFPYGNPEHQTYKCHTGDNIFTFGNVAFTQQPDRDGQDISFAQLALDSWTAFVRNHDPNPDAEYLRARGHLDTLKAVEQADTWPAVNSNNPMKRLLSTSSVDVPFNELDQCKDLGLSLNMYD